MSKLHLRLRSAKLVEAATVIAAIGTLTVLSAGVSPAAASEVTRSAEVHASASDVWSAIGGFCAIKDWHPAIGTCTEDGKTPPTRTLVTKDGKVTFVETQVARDEAAKTYSYNFVSSPFPVSEYVGTITVTPKDETTSTITWHGVYTANAGKEKDANDAFASVYEAGLAALQTRFAN